MASSQQEAAAAAVAASAAGPPHAGPNAGFMFMERLKSEAQPWLDAIKQDLNGHMYIHPTDVIKKLTFEYNGLTWSTLLTNESILEAHTTFKYEKSGTATRDSQSILETMRSFIRGTVTTSCEKAHSCLELVIQDESQHAYTALLVFFKTDVRLVEISARSHAGNTRSVLMRSDVYPYTDDEIEDKIRKTLEDKVLLDSTWWEVLKDNQQKMFGGRHMISETALHNILSALHQKTWIPTEIIWDHGTDEIVYHSQQMRCGSCGKVIIP